ncbi:MAG: globin [Planctomycetota bacterium]
MTETPVDPVGDVVSIVGESRIREMVAAFYRRVRQDDLIGPMYPEQDFAGAEQRLAGFLVQRFGGSGEYSRQRGHPRLRMRHAPFQVDRSARDRWMKLMGAAIAEVELEDSVRARVHTFLDEVATFLINC